MFDLVFELSKAPFLDLISSLRFADANVPISFRALISSYCWAYSLSFWIVLNNKAVFLVSWPVKLVSWEPRFDFDGWSGFLSR